MALQVLSITPEDSDNDVGIDSKITIEFNGPIDPFTVSRGISVYCETESIWSGPDLAQLDTKHRDVLQIGPDYSFYTYTYTIDGNTVTLKLPVSMVPDKQHYISVLPGGDPTRYVSTPTVGTVIYNKIDNTSTGICEILSSYTGSTNDNYDITISSNNKIDVILGSNYIGEFDYILNEPIPLGELKISLSGTWTVGDIIHIPVYKAIGVDAIYKSKFTTSKYEITTPSSVKIEDKIKADSIYKSLKVIGTVPKGVSVNNSKCNPVIIKFNQPIEETQSFLDCISISKTDLFTGQIKAINYYVKVVGDTIKIYMISVDQYGITDQALKVDDIAQDNLDRQKINILR